MDDARSMNLPLKIEFMHCYIPSRTPNTMSRFRGEAVSLDPREMGVCWSDRSSVYTNVEMWNSD